ncbi:MAG: acetate--CoA ligase [Phycisphaerae bacterium]|nr:acetate--CoA ligase [Phycisphaerae bacterium]
MSDDSRIESVLSEQRVFDPPADFAERCGGAWVESMEVYRELHEASVEDPENFWGAIANELDWFEPWTSVLDWDAPDAKWFVNGKINACYNCVDRLINMGHGDQAALIWEGEPVGEEGPEVRTLTYRELHAEVCRFANGLKSLGVERGDIVTIYMGMVPELTIAVLACARIGAPHSVIFGGFSAAAIADRVEDAKSETIITCDGAWRRGSVVPLKANVDEAMKSTDHVKNVVVLRRCNNEIDMHVGRDHFWSDLVEDQSDECPCEPMDSEDMLFLLYTSGSTGKPKGIMHTTGGYLVHTYLTSRYTFNLRPGQDHVYWCTADVGWITGHSYIIYGILQNHVPTLMYEGAPNHPDPDRFWEIVDRHKVTHFYTAPTAIRAFMKWGEEHPRKHDLSSLCVLGTVGEPINPEAWMWYHRVIGHERCPIVDTWWQTETGGHMITPLPAATPAVPGSCTLPFLGIDAAVVDKEGHELNPNEGGLLVVRKPWPSMLRGIYGDRQRFIDTYFSTVEGMYFAGDSARRDDRGYFWIMGRMDDVINVSGHRLGTMEVESALVSHDAVVEAAVVGMPHEIKGTGIAAFCSLSPAYQADDHLRDVLREHVAKEIGAIAKPDMIRFTDALPKTRSGKIMRRLLRDIAAGKESTGDMTTLEDFSVIASLRGDEE